MKKFILGLVAIAAIAASVYASAASLDVNGGTVQAGGDTDLVCTTDAVEVVSWAVNTYPVLEGVESVKIKGIPEACNGARIMGRVQLTDSDSNNNNTWAYTSGVSPWGSGTYEVIANGNSDTLYTLYLKKADYATQWYVPAEKIVGLKIWVEGTTN